MPFIQNILRSMLPSGVNVVVANDAVRGVMGKSVEDLYAEQPHLRTVTDFIAQNVAGLPLKCYIRNADTDRERDTTGALPLLLRDPNPDMTGYDLIYQSIMEWSLYGRIVWLVGRSSSSRSGWEIRIIPNAWITQKAGSDGFSYRELKFRPKDGAASTVTVQTSQCVIFTSYKPGEPSNALSPVESLRQTLAEQMEAQEFRRGVWKNAARITGYITRPSGLDWSDAAAKRFREDIKNNWGRGGGNSGGTPVLEDGMSYQSVEFNAKEKDWASGVQLSREDVAAAYHINPSLIWPGSGQTYASAKDNARSLYADTLTPLMTMISQRINKSLLPMIGAPANEYVEFDIKAKLQGSFEEQATALQSAVGGPWMSRPEARALMNSRASPTETSSRRSTSSSGGSRARTTRHRRPPTSWRTSRARAPRALSSSQETRRRGRRRTGTRPTTRSRRTRRCSAPSTAGSARRSYRRSARSAGARRRPVIRRGGTPSDGTASSPKTSWTRSWRDPSGPRRRHSPPWASTRPCTTSRGRGTSSSHSPAREPSISTP